MRRNRMVWVVAAIALATLPAQAQLNADGTLEGGAPVASGPIPVTLTIVPFAEVDLNPFPTLVVTDPGNTGSAQMPTGSLHINTTCDVSVLATAITVTRTQGGVDRAGLATPYTAGPGVGDKAAIAGGSSTDPFYWDVVAKLTAAPAAGPAAQSYAGAGVTDTFTGDQTCGFGAVPIGIYALDLDAQFTTNFDWDATALANTTGTNAYSVNSTITVVVSGS